MNAFGDGWAETCKIFLQIHVRSVTNSFTGEAELLFLRAHLHGLFPKLHLFERFSDLTVGWIGRVGFPGSLRVLLLLLPADLCGSIDSRMRTGCTFGSQQKGAETHTGCPFLRATPIGTNN